MAKKYEVKEPEHKHCWHELGERVIVNEGYGHKSIHVIQMCCDCKVVEKSDVWA